MTHHLQVEQAIFTSSNHGTTQGYQLVARSAGIDQELAKQLTRWSPSHGGLSDENLDHWVVSYRGLDDGRAVIARTLLGGAEYSGRGGTQVITQLLVLRDDQFALYHCNPFAVVETALTLGELRFSLARTPQLPPLALPRQPIVSCVRVPCGPTLRFHHIHPSDGVAVGTLLAVLQRLHIGQSVAVIGSDEPLKFASHVIERIPTDERPAISVTTGLEPSLARPFRLHFLPSLNDQRRRVLESLGVEWLETAASDQSEAQHDRLIKDAASAARTS